MPRARISTIGAMPDPSFRFEPGQCSTLTSRSAMSACSASVTQTQCAAQRRVAREARVGRGTPGSCARPRAAARPRLRPRFRCVGVHEDVLLAGQRRDRLEQLARARHGESRREGRAQPAVGGAVPAPLQRQRSRRSTPASARAGVAARASSLPSPSCTCRPSPSCPLAASVSNTTSVSCTVSIVSAVVVPERSSSAAASRVAARSVDGVCAASSGQTRRRSQSSSGMSSAKRSEERLAQMDVRLHEAREEVAAARVDDAVRSFFGSGRPTTILPSRTRTSPSTTSRRSFIVTMVPLRMSVALTWNIDGTAARSYLEERDAALTKPALTDVRVGDAQDAECAAPDASTTSRATRVDAPADGDELGDDADGDFGGSDGADVEADRRVHALEALAAAGRFGEKRLTDADDLGAAADEPEVREVARRERAHGLEIGLVPAGHDHGVGRRRQRRLCAATRRSARRSLRRHRESARGWRTSRGRRRRGCGSRRRGRARPTCQPTWPAPMM